MEKLLYKVTLSDSTEIENLKLNGNNFVSETEITEDIFKGKLSAVTITDSNGGEQIIENAELISVQEHSGEWWFSIRETPETIRIQKQMQANIQYIAMMTDVEL